LQKLPTAADLAADFVSCLEREGFELLAIAAEHAIRAGLLDGTPKDPFDACSLHNELVFDEYGVRRIW